MSRSQVVWLGRALAIVPAVVLGAQALTGGLGANPIEALLNRLGWWTLLVLLASLAITPVRTMFKVGVVAPWRRTFGLAAFWYGLAHVSVYLGVDKFFDVAEVWEDVVKRPFITVGAFAFVLLLVLAITSTARMVKRLGGKRWRAVHRMAYVAAAAGVVHFIWRVKADLREPLIFGSVLAILLAVRVALWLRKRTPLGAAKLK
ncbi:MAG: protein-methionine-sulfoxide reductase heme-binding subunit MsrQ [Deltaproteobacteria bacterium]|nr:protein-methionine-sulfoxide reductase heme-binding subunit MsrQ [Deltaproteobacteria bacterium]